MNHSINSLAEKFINELNSLFNELLAAETLYDIGRDNIDSISDYAAISPIVGFDIQLEPIPMSEIKLYKNRYPHFILEVYHGKFVQLWNDIIDETFCVLIEQHLSGTRKFTELKKQDVLVNFDSDEDLLIQIKNNLAVDFSFKEYSERQRIINKVLNPNNECVEHLANIKKNVLLRNLIQHRNNCVDEYILKKLGCTHVELLDENGNITNLGEGDKIILSIPCIYDFMSSLLYIINKWGMQI